MKSTPELEGCALAKRIVLDMLSDPVHTDIMCEVAERYAESPKEFRACKKEIRRLLKLLHTALKRGERVPVLVRNS